MRRLSWAAAVKFCSQINPEIISLCLDTGNFFSIHTFSNSLATRGQNKISPCLLSMKLEPLVRPLKYPEDDDRIGSMPGTASGENIILKEITAGHSSAAN